MDGADDDAFIATDACPCTYADYYSRNPQYFITLSDPDPYDEQSRCPVVISLAQRQEERKKEHAIGFKVYRCGKSDTTLSENFMRTNNSVRGVVL